MWARVALAALFLSSSIRVAAFADGSDKSNFGSWNIAFIGKYCGGMPLFRRGYGPRLVAATHINNETLGGIFHQS